MLVDVRTLQENARMLGDRYMRRFFAAITVSAGVLMTSCGEVIKDISFQTGDYLGTGYDEPPASSQTSKKKSDEHARTLTREEDMPDIYERTVNLTAEEVELLLKTELENRNFKIIYVAHVSKGAQEQGIKDFWQNMNLYLVCKLSECTKVLKNNPQLLGQFPIRVYTYQKDGMMVVGAFRPSTALKYMGNPDTEAIKVLKQMDREIKEVIDSIR